MSSHDAKPLKIVLPPPPQPSGHAQARLEATLAAVNGLCAAVPRSEWRDVTAEQIARRAVNIADATLVEMHLSEEVAHGSHR